LGQLGLSLIIGMYITTESSPGTISYPTRHIILYFIGVIDNKLTIKGTVIFNHSDEE
jgi:hypothetical protein